MRIGSSVGWPGVWVASKLAPIVKSDKLLLFFFFFLCMQFPLPVNTRNLKQEVQLAGVVQVGRVYNYFAGHRYAPGMVEWNETLVLHSEHQTLVPCSLGPNGNLFSIEVTVGGWSEWLRECYSLQSFIQSFIEHSWAIHWFNHSFRALILALISEWPGWIQGFGWVWECACSVGGGCVV